ncbi:adenylyltransferase/cytidyltransferase family protein [Vampirovibrio sp.]|uniref:adenylyltransferase/cytidyltransferase family protein n=1 Tax=Vampirovibrio sp. TaxID=2717857 RepID=UPI003593CE20
MGQVLSTEKLLEDLAPLRGQSSIVTTNGCFDILHVGHLRYLQGCKSMGDILVLMLNSDASVRRLKGPQRPIVPQADRAELLAGLGCVDYVVLFDEDTPEPLMEIIRPDFHAKGAQYNEDNLPEIATLRKIGAKVKFVPMVENRSTTSLIDTIKQRLLADDSQAPVCSG